MEKSYSIPAFKGSSKPWTLHYLDDRTWEDVFGSGVERFQHVTLFNNLVIINIPPSSVEDVATAYQAAHDKQSFHFTDVNNMTWRVLSYEKPAAILIENEYMTIIVGDADAMMTAFIDINNEIEKINDDFTP